MSEQHGLQHRGTTATGLDRLPGGILLTSVEKIVRWARRGSLWPATFGLACCAI